MLETPETQTRLSRGLRALSSLIPGIKRAGVNLVLPPACPVCRAPTSESGTVCAACWRGLTFITEPVCQVLGTPLPYDPGVPVVSPAAQADPPPWERARAAVIYDDTARRLVSSFKYRDRLDLAPGLAGMMVRAGAPLLADADLIVPIPLHLFRLWGRRFNQAQELARHVAKRTGVPLVPDALVRKRATRRQVGLNALARQRNVAGAFAVSDNGLAQVAGKRILLIDDVLTTGATARAAVRALKKTGAAVDVLTFAMVAETV